ncbi:MAG: hypothetical protein R3C32_12980 [Chloroflexota bacterium]
MLSLWRVGLRVDLIAPAVPQTTFAVSGATLRRPFRSGQPAMAYRAMLAGVTCAMRVLLVVPVAARITGRLLLDIIARSGGCGRPTRQHPVAGVAPSASSLGRRSLASVGPSALALLSTFSLDIIADATVVHRHFDDHGAWRIHGPERAERALFS